MTEKRQAKRQDLRLRLIDAARQRIMAEGLSALRARDVTHDAGCALGGLYTAFSDLHALVIQVNSLTLASLKDSLALQKVQNSSPADRLRNLARGYLAFALANRNLWRSLFEHRLPDGQETPPWHLEEHLFLIGLIAEPLGDLQPEMTDENRSIRARTLFGAVHGVISISLEGRFVGLPVERLERELDDFVMTIAAGAASEKGWH